MSQASVRAFAPGRVNLIGEHTDYNDGLCLPFAIERGVTVTAEPLSHGDYIEAHALDLSEQDRFPLDPDSGDRSDGWRPFLRGAIAELRDEGLEAPPCRLEIEGDLPRGVGLSSSAALSVALCLALCAIGGAEPPERLALARLCSRIENDWAGQQTGLLDQLASLYGEEGSAVRIDMRGPQIRPVELDLGDHLLATVDSGASRSLAASGYNQRRWECHDAAAALGVQSLRDDYEVSVPQVERAVATCKQAGALGARIVGGGFGGSVLALFPPGADPPQGAVRVGPGPGARLLAI